MTKTPEAPSYEGFVCYQRPAQLPASKINGNYMSVLYAEKTPKQVVEIKPGKLSLQRGEFKIARALLSKNFPDETPGEFRMFSPLSAVHKRKTAKLELGYLEGRPVMQYSTTGEKPLAGRHRLRKEPYTKTIPWDGEPINLDMKMKGLYAHPHSIGFPEDAEVHQLKIYFSLPGVRWGEDMILHMIQKDVYMSMWNSMGGSGARKRREIRGKVF